MDCIYRVAQDERIFYAVRRGAEWRRVALHGHAIFEGYADGDVIAGGLDAVRVLAPVRPSKLVCVGLNYRDHAAEMKKTLPQEPLLFLKPPTTVLDPGGTIPLPPGVGRVDFEGELGVVIGRRAHRVSRDRAWDYVFGLTAVNDVTARDIQNREIQYTRAKGFDRFGPIGPCIARVTGDRPRRVETTVSGQRRQSSTTDQLIFPIDFLIEYITFVMTLEPGDIISTGTPSGVGPLAAGDTVTVSVEDVGELTNFVDRE